MTARSVVALVLLAGCREGAPRLRDTSSTGPLAPRPVPSVMVRVAFAADSAASAAMADSLGRDGWVTPGPVLRGGPTGWPVTVAVPGKLGLARLIMHELRREGLAPEVTGYAAHLAPAAIDVIPVNGGTHGMSARVRWTLAADRGAVLVVEDPRAVENDPVPNGFVFASQGAPPVQRDSVWDVAPSPDWRRVAYARAYTTNAGETDSLPPSEWHRLAGQVGLLESLVRRHAFPTSGMVVAYGAARPFVVDPRVAADSAGAKARGLPIAEGWRVGWSVDGTRLAIGAPPELIADDAPAAHWRFVDPASGDDRGTATTADIAPVAWTEGPTLDISNADGMRQRRAFRAGDVDVESEGGWIRVFVRDRTRFRAAQIIGPGVALTTTANGQYIVAIAPDPDAKSYEPSNQLVVYQIAR